MNSMNPNTKGLITLCVQNHLTPQTDTNGWNVKLDSSSLKTSLWRCQQYHVACNMQETMPIHPSGCQNKKDFLHRTSSHIPRDVSRFQYSSWCWKLLKMTCLLIPTRLPSPLLLVLQKQLLFARIPCQTWGCAKKWIPTATQRLCS